MEILLGVLIVFSLLQLFVTLAIGVFLVRFRDRTNKIFSDLIEAMEIMWGAVPVAPTATPNDNRPKTWDEKYEEELEAMSRRLREQSGLKDLPDQGVSWGTPPALNTQNAEGLTITDRKVDRLK